MTNLQVIELVADARDHGIVDHDIPRMLVWVERSTIGWTAVNTGELAHHWSQVKGNGRWPHRRLVGIEWIVQATGDSEVAQQIGDTAIKGDTLALSALIDLAMDSVLV